MKTFPTHIVAAAGIVENDRGEILMVKNHRAGWVFPGGQVETGENLIEAVKREILEEAGVSVSVSRLICVSSNIGSYPGFGGYDVVPTKVMFDFLCAYEGGEIRPSEENSETRWVPRERAAAMITAPAYIERFSAYLEFDGSVRYLTYVSQPEFALHLSRSM